jgi:hypothetical protein
MQLDLFEWIDDLDPIAEFGDLVESWTYGVVELINGDLVLAEIMWDKDECPLAWTEASFIVDKEEGLPEIMASLQNAVLDLANEAPISETVFYTYRKS